MSKVYVPTELMGTQLWEHCKEGMTLNLICSKVPTLGEKCLVGAQEGLSNKLGLSSKFSLH